MKAVILAGGFGTRISEETHLKPKPMIEVGGKPMLWHVMKIYSSHGITDFIVCLGYKGYVIKEYFANYFIHTSDVTFDLASNRVETHRRYSDPWRVTLIDTGERTQTGGRLKRVREYIGNEDFCFTYGDGVADVNVTELVQAHRKFGTLATVTAVQPPGRFGMLTLQENRIRGFKEKPDGDGGWINGGFFVLSPKAIDYVDGDDTSWERDPLERLAADGQLSAFVHRGFWQPMDHLRDKEHLEALWRSGRPPWKVWT
nr:glucose-1-phosphate cytidylyltransferase [uncultured bacterium]